MSYETYTILQEFLDGQIVKCRERYLEACSFIPRGKKYRAVHEHAWKTFVKERDKLYERKDELKAAVRAVYQDHPDPEMRKYWGIE